jgi:hypothetical protein
VQVVAGQPLNLGFLIHHLGAASDYNTPPCPGVLVVVIGFKADQSLAFGRGELRPLGGAEDWILPVNDVVDGQNDHLAIREKSKPSHWDRAQQPQAFVEGHYLKPSVIRWIQCHFRLLLKWVAYRGPCSTQTSPSDGAAISRRALITRPLASKRSVATSSLSYIALTHPGCRGRIHDC